MLLCSYHVVICPELEWPPLPSVCVFVLKCKYNFVVTEQPVRWTWDERKNASNKRKHHLRFETAALVFDDPLALLLPDPYPHEERWQTVGRIGPVTVFVVHTLPTLDPATGQETGRIISARRATAHERKAYEEGNSSPTDS